MKVYRSCRGISPLILNLSARWKWLFKFTPRPLYFRQRTPVFIVYVCQLCCQPYMNDIANANTLWPLPHFLIVFQSAQLPPAFDAEVGHGGYKSVQHRLDRCHPFSWTHTPLKMPLDGQRTCVRHEQRHDTLNSGRNASLSLCNTSAVAQRSRPFPVLRVNDRPRQDECYFLRFSFMTHLLL